MPGGHRSSKASGLDGLCGTLVPGRWSTGDHNVAVRPEETGNVTSTLRLRPSDPPAAFPGTTD